MNSKLTKKKHILVPHANRDPIKGSRSEIPGTSEHYGIEGFKGGVLIDSDSSCNIFHQSMDLIFNLLCDNVFFSTIVHMQIFISENSIYSGL